jgi:hypothetical protein
MFCPKCKSEYRFGFTRCEDCDVDLVESLDAPGNRAPGDDLSAPVLLWSGFHTGTLEEIRAALDEANIAYNDEPLEARLLYASMRNPLEIWVQKADFDAARKLIAKQLAGDSDVAPGYTDSGLVEPDEPPQGPCVVGVPGSGSVRRSILANLNSPDANAAGAEDPETSPEDEIPEQPYDATEDVEEPSPSNNPEDEPSIEVWTGTESDIADYVAMCLREDAIRFSRFPDSAGGIRILVFPDREERARLIVREVVDGKLPE